MVPVWTRSGLRAAGIGASELRLALRHGELVRLGRDRYGPPGPIPLDRQLAPADSGVALRALTAARAWGLPAPAGRAEVLLRHGCERPAFGGGVDIRRTRSWDVVERGGLQLTDLARTAADVACEHDLEISVPVLDASLRTGVDADAIRSRLGRGVTGAARGRTALSLADARAESPLESRLRLLLTLGGLPPQDLQRVVRDRHGAFIGRVDLWYPGLVVEADGYAFHGSREDFRRDLEKGVEYARLGLLVQRFSWDAVVGRPRSVVAAVGDAAAIASGSWPPALPERAAVGARTGFPRSASA